MGGNSFDVKLLERAVGQKNSPGKAGKAANNIQSLLIVLLIFVIYVT